MKFYKFDELNKMAGLRPFMGLDKWMTEITNAVIRMSDGDYWLCVDDDADDDAVKALWARRINQIDGYCRMIGPSVEARLKAASEAKAGVAKTKTKFNDAPDTARDWSSDEHMSTVTSAESSSDLSSFEKDDLGKVYGIMSAVADDIMRKFVIRAEFV